MMRYLRSFWPLVLAAYPCLGQTWSVGGAAGFGSYHDATITNGTGSASAGFGPRIAVGGVLSENVGEYFGGELRYTFRDGDSVLRSGGQEVNMDAAAHALHYDFLAYATPRHSRFRPYAAAGGGIKRYTATGTQYISQPLSNFAVLTHTDEVKALISFGGGVKVRLSEHWQIRADFRDYVTPFPENLFALAPGSKIHGWLHDFVPLAGLDWTFGKP
jgi:hypothetical protein